MSLTTPSAWDSVTVVVVTYNSAHVVGSCLAALAPARRVIVVDNASTDGTRDAARRALPSVEIVANPFNMGYGTANNIGFERADTPYVLLLNPDTIPDPGAIEALVSAAAAYPEAAVIAPLLMSPDDEPEIYLMGPHERNHHRRSDIPQGPLCTWFIMGAAMLWRLPLWRKLGGYDEAIFLYGEDTDLSLRCSRAGHGMVLTPDAIVRHLGGRSERPSWRTRWRKDWHMTWGHLYVESKWGDASAMRAQAWRLLRRHGLKALLYVILLRPRRMLGNLARAHAAAAFLRGRPAWPGRPGVA